MGSENEMEGEVTQGNIKLKQMSHLEFLSYGTSQIFERRSNRLKTLRSILTFLGIVLPVAVGGLYISFGQSESLMNNILMFAGGLGVAQLVLSTWALVSGWDSQYESAIKSLQGNITNFNRCKRFATTTFRSEVELQSVFESILRDTEQQELIDITQHITLKEKHFAYQASLDYYNSECHACKQNPNKNSNNKSCSSCGQTKEK
jgi:mobilome CxxCx(11)CxxC protein